MFDYKCKVKRIVDGDTLDAYIDLGFDVWVTKRIRFMGIDTPESRTRDKVEKRYGKGAKHRLVDMLEGNDNKFIVRSHGTGKFGRVLGELYIPEFECSLNEQMITEGHAVAYFGGSKQEVKDALLEARNVSTEYVMEHVKAIK
jgi:endonuclease YncB( thermonuclease family)